MRGRQGVAQAAAGGPRSPTRWPSAVSAIAVLGLGVAAFLILGTGSASAATTEVDIVGFNFVPPTVTVTQGDTVRWTNRDTAPHTATASGKWDSGNLDQGQAYALDTSSLAVGSHVYICTYHPSMQGSLTVQARANAPPTAAFTATSNGMRVNVDASGSTDSEGPIASYSWQFGDGGVATGRTTSHTYAVEGTFTITLKVVDSAGAEASTTRQVAIQNLDPVAAFSVDPASDASTSVELAFSDGSTDADGHIASWAWDFGDENTSTARHPVHRFGRSGAYTVRLTVTDNVGGTASATRALEVANTPPVADFAFDAAAAVAGSPLPFRDLSTDVDGSIAAWTWVFGDATGSDEREPSVTYAAAGAYDVLLEVTDDEGAKANVTRRVTVRAADEAPPENLPPVAAFTFTVAGLTVHVDASESTDPNGDALAFDWDWGDGSTRGSGAEAAHTYARAGTYTVSVTVTDPAGLASPKEARAVTVRAPVVDENDPPEAKLVANATGLDVVGDASGSLDADGEVVSFLIDWGDGSAPSPGPRASHSYAKAGTWTITLTVRDDEGATATATKRVTVKELPPIPKPATVQIDADGLAVAAAVVDGVAGARYTWRWGDGSPDTSGAQARHEYERAGRYEIRLLARLASDVETETLTNVTLAAPTKPTAAFFAFPDGLSVTFASALQAPARGLTFAWDFGDGDLGVGTNVTHTYRSAGAYRVELALVLDGEDANASVRTIRVDLASTESGDRALPSPITAALVAAVAAASRALAIGTRRR